MDFPGQHMERGREIDFTLIFTTVILPTVAREIGSDSDNFLSPNTITTYVFVQLATST